MKITCRYCGSLPYYVKSKDVANNGIIEIKHDYVTYVRLDYHDRNTPRCPKCHEKVKIENTY